jgi:hypothetical protein
MEYSKIVAVSGLPGLFELINSKNDGAIVRSLDDKTTKFISGRVHQFTHLESIEIYTSGNNVNLVDIFQSMEKAGKALPSEKDQNAIKKYFEQVYPELDFERVYPSDMKKMIRWYGILTANRIEIKLSEQPEEEITEEEQVEQVKEEKEKPAKKTATRSKTAKKDEEIKKPAAKKKSAGKK